MPLAFHSKSHGTVAFGFFQIELDMLLLEHWFFFADEFCNAVQAIHGASTANAVASIEGYQIAEVDKVGNVNGAIGGWDRSGFIGATYERFPFPADRANFKQKPDGARNRDWARLLVGDFGTQATIPVCSSAESGTVTIGDIVFSGDAYAELIDYVERGGYPRWQSDTPPEYVAAMRAQLAQ